LFHDMSLDDEAIAEAFRALRDNPDDKQMIMNFIGLVFSSENKENEVDRALENDPGDEAYSRNAQEPNEEEGLPHVTGDTWVLLEANGADPVEYLIYNDQPVDRGRGEFLATDTPVSDLIGKAKGDLVIRNAGR